ncbi:MAG TPA: hypothetical protein VF613_10275 [Longimicrobium sp.]|jgi:hypothetical protein
MSWMKVCAAALVVAAACTRPAAGPEPLPTSGPDIIGTITTRREVEGEWIVHVEQDSTRSAGYPRAQVTVGRGTRVLRRSGDALVAASPEELRVGTRVRAWFAGIVVETLTVQVSAHTVVINP